jgi:predicted acylesterase/phospholipase RssA
MLAELIGAGVRPDVIVSVSAGALNGAFLAFDPSPKMIEQMAVLWSRMTTKEVLGLSWRSLLGLLGLRDHIASPEGLRSLLKRELPYRAFAETAVPLHAVCAELVTGEAVVISSGNMAEAIIASTAIPGIFPPVECEGGILWMERSLRLHPFRWPPLWGPLESSFYPVDSLVRSIRSQSEPSAEPYRPLRYSVLESYVVTTSITRAPS